MYEAHYNLREKPFSLLPDPEYLFLGNSHSMALCILQYALTGQTGFTVLTGEVGCGKTTLIRHLLNVMDPNLTVGLISDTHDFRGELLKRILYALGQDYKTASGRTDLLQRLTTFVVSEYAQGQRVVIVIDEAQNMRAKSLEELRTLSNVNADKHQLLQVVLIGQPELRDTLCQPALRPFAQRIAIDYHLGHLAQDETTSYIRHRLKAVGGDPGIFPDMVCQIVHVATGGTPRLINLICELALVYGYGMERTCIDVEVIERVLLDKSRGGLFAPASSLSSIEPKATARSSHNTHSAPPDRALVPSHPPPAAYIQGGVHVLVNEPYARLLGFDTPDALLGIPLHSVVVPAQRHQLRSLLQCNSDNPHAGCISKHFAVQVGGDIFPLTLSFDRAKIKGQDCALVTVSPVILFHESADPSEHTRALRQQLSQHDTYDPSPGVRGGDWGFRPRHPRT